jgi:hypothetical protein
MICTIVTTLATLAVILLAITVLVGGLYVTGTRDLDELDEP